MDTANILGDTSMELPHTSGEHVAETLRNVRTPQAAQRNGTGDGAHGRSPGANGSDGAGRQQDKREVWQGVTRRSALQDSCGGGVGDGRRRRRGGEARELKGMEEAGQHLFVFVHGFQGNQYDLRMLKNAMADIFPDVSP